MQELCGALCPNNVPFFRVLMNSRLKSDCLLKVHQSPSLTDVFCNPGYVKELRYIKEAFYTKEGFLINFEIAYPKKIYRHMFKSRIGKNC